MPVGHKPQPQQYWHLGQITNSLLWVAVLCMAAALAASLTSTHNRPIAPPPLIWDKKMAPDIAECPL